MSEYPLNPEGSIITIDLHLYGKSGIRLKLKMALDTGASMTTIPVEAAITIGCDPAKSKRRIEMITASGIEYVPVVTVPKIELFDSILNNVDVICHELPSRSLVSGLLGLNVIKKFNIELRFLEKTLRITR